MTNTKLSKLFITGCDASAEWMLPWFVENLRKHTDIPLMIFDFGMEGSLYPELRKSCRTNAKGWFKKPSAMVKAAAFADQVCWLDTDCEVLGDISGVFDYIVPNKLSMVQDKPWTTRQRQMWHNSGVVAFQDVPQILKEWEQMCMAPPARGDQEVLHWMLGDNPLNRMIHIEDIPNRYNVLRLQHIDNTVPKNPLIYHWTGAKGKDHIRKLMNG